MEEENEISGFQLNWDEVTDDNTNELISEEIYEDGGEDDIIEEEYLVGEEIIPTNEINAISNSLDQSAAENLIYMAQDGNMAMSDLIEEQVEQAENVDYNNQQYFECQVTEEEVITDDWVQRQGEERVEIIIDTIATAQQNEAGPNDDQIEVPLPTDQDEYTASRPYPCDFCSRRFRKKANLMNHMIAHQNDRPHVCNLCGARYIRKCDLLNHLKIHAYAPDHEELEFQVEMPSIQKINRGRDKRSGGRSKGGYKVKLEREDFNDQLIQEDVKQLMYDVTRQHENYSRPPKPDRFPVTDARKPFVCQQCGLSFAREKALISHSKAHGTDSPLECEHCGEMFWDVVLLREHELSHQEPQHSGYLKMEDVNSEDEEFRIEEMHNQLDEDDTLSDLEAEGNRNKFGDFYCDTCGLSFHRQVLLKSHMKNVHSSQGQAKSKALNNEEECFCNVCGDSFTDPLDLLTHAETHSRFQQFKCTLCGEAFLKEDAIREHIQKAHEFELEPNSCPICGKGNRNFSALEKHLDEHSKEKTNSCSKCGKTFYNKARLKRHMMSHRNKTVMCDICEQEFPDGRTLMNHRHSHSSTSSKQFPCKECGKTFGSRSSQQIHVRTHTGERPYGCRYCWKAFADGGTLRKHERIHTGEKPYGCSVCPRAFNQRVVLREHIRSHHSAPDPDRASTTMPFQCPVCGSIYSTAFDLIQDLINHSDENTQRSRPIQSGPRKYKRRRKLKPQELKRLRAEREKSGDLDYSSNEEVQQESDGQASRYAIRELKASKSNSRTSHKEANVRPSKMRKFSSSIFESEYESSTNQRDSTLLYNNQEFDVSGPIQPDPLSIPQPQFKEKTVSTTRPRLHSALEKSRPKMIHTQKTRVTVDDGKRKTKTLITRSEHSTRATSSATTTRPRTKNVKYHIYQEKVATATFDTAEIIQPPQLKIKKEATVDDSLDQHEDLRLDENLELTKRNYDKFSMDIVNDLEAILRSPIRSKNSESSTTGPDLPDTLGKVNIEPNPKRKAGIECRRSYIKQEIDASKVPNRVSDDLVATTDSSMKRQKTTSRAKPTYSRIGSTSAIESLEQILESPLKIDKCIKKENSLSEFKCDICDVLVKSREELLTHVRAHF